MAKYTALANPLHNIRNMWNCIVDYAADSCKLVNFLTHVIINMNMIIISIPGTRYSVQGDTLVVRSYNKMAIMYETYVRKI